MTKRKKKQEVPDENVNEIRYFDKISVDLVIKILSRLPAKSMGKCRCVSKKWSSIISRANYDQLFPITSTPPSLLFVGEPHRQIQKKLSFYSSPHHQIHDKKSSFIDPIHLTNTVTDYYRLCPPVAGLVCRQQSGVNSTYAVICNPVTGKYVTTPKVTIEGFIETNLEIYFGYDPVDKVFKVLSLTWSLRDGSHKYQVLTLGTENLSWRKIQRCTIFHYPPRDDGKGICVNGVLYYTAALNSKKRIIVCFHVRSEKFSFINIPHEYLERKICVPLILIDYNGELGVIECSIGSNFFALWVLKDAEEHKWSHNSYEIPDMLRPRLTTAPVLSAGMLGTDEIVFYHKYGTNPYYIFCYNLQKNLITRVGFVVPTLDWVECYQVDIFSNFVEDAKLMF